MTSDVVDPTCPPLSITVLPRTIIRANAYTPNTMTTEAFAELVAEVRHLGRLPKPIVVRPSGDGYEIVDGEHGWRAATEASLDTVPCEIIDADDFESRRQTYKRNQHGIHDPVRLGQIFEAMMEARGLSRRALAAEIEVSEGTIRNAIAYAHASRLRNGYAGPKSSPRRGLTIERLSVRQVRAYTWLPPAIANLWFECGADLAVLGEGLRDHLKATERRVDDDEPARATSYEWRERTGLVPFVKASKAKSFAAAIKQISKWYYWERQWCALNLTTDDLRPYTRHHFCGTWPVRDPVMMDSALQLIVDTRACAITPGRRYDGPKPVVHVTPDEFEQAIQASRSNEEFCDLLRALVLAKAPGLPDSQVSQKHELQYKALIAADPPYLRGSRLPRYQQFALWQARGWKDASAPISVDAAKHELAQQHRIDHAGGDIEEAIEDQLKQILARERLVLAQRTLTDAEMANAIAKRMPIYNEQNRDDQQAIAAMTGTLLHFTRAELLCLFKYSEYLEWTSTAQTLLKALKA